MAMALAFAACVAVVAACVPTGPSPGESALRYVKRTVFGAQALAEVSRIGAGTQQPVLEFTVEDTPPSIFVNWIVPDDQAANFAAVAPLPPGFSLAKVRIVESDPVPRYWLSLNVYRVSGITVGLRTEWSTYVDDGSGTPRFMILVARASEGSLDPIGPLALPEPFNHTIDAAGVIRTAMNRTELQGSIPVLTSDNLFNSTIALPAPAARTYEVPTRQWVTANDFIYWRNGVNDRIFHNSTSHSAPLISVDPSAVTLDDDSAWGPFVTPTPGHVLVYLDKIQFMIGPWWNITEPDGRVAPATRTALFDLKKSLYNGLAGVNALAVVEGRGEPLLQTTAENAPPSVSWHWRVPAANVANLATAIGLPAGLTLAPIRLQDGDAPDYWLSLRVRRESGATSGLRSDWTTYVDDGTRIHTLILESASNTPALDPTKIVDVAQPYTPPSAVTHVQAGSTVTTNIGTGPTGFSSTFDLPSPGADATALADRQWIGASDLQHWRNGVADRVFYDSSVFDPRVAVDPSTATTSYGGPWNSFVAATPDRVWVDRAALDLVINPWFDLAGN